MAILLEMTLTGGVLILLVLLLRTILLNRLPKTAFIVMWAVVLLRLLVPVSFFGTGAIAADSTSEAYTLEAATSTEEPVSADGVIALDSYDAESETIAETVRQVNVFRIVWLTGAVICAVVLVLSYILSFRRFRRSEDLETDFISSFQSSNKLRRTVTVKLSDKTTTPMTYGIIHPVILLPMGMDLSDQKQLKYVLMHEYIHIRKLDNLLKGVSSVAVCIHWFNPLVWVMNRFLSRDIELRCDETLLKHCEGDCRAEYALTLIDLEDKRRRSLAVGTAFAKEPAEERITAIMKYRRATPLSAIAMVLCITMLCAAFVGCGVIGTSDATAVNTASVEENLAVVDTATAVADATATTIADAMAGTTIALDAWSRLDELAEDPNTLVFDINKLVDSQNYDCDFGDIQFTKTLPYGMYISDGLVYDSDGKNVGKLRDGDECMVVDGTGETEDGYLFLTICIDVYASNTSESQDPVEVVSTEGTSEQFYELQTITLCMDDYNGYYPICEIISTTVTGKYGGTDSVNEDQIVTSYSGETTFTFYTTSIDSTSFSVKLIYVVPLSLTDIYLYF